PGEGTTEKALRPEIREKPRQIAEQAVRRRLEERAGGRGLVPESIRRDGVQGGDAIAPATLVHPIDRPGRAVCSHRPRQRVLSSSSPADPQDPSFCVPDEPRERRLTDSERREKGGGGRRTEPESREQRAGPVESHRDEWYCESLMNRKKMTYQRELT